jgi:4-diphosphocytidyl-2-C-methyl-D-erythritol kinase
MLLFPNAKINLGLAITERRRDGYHNLQTVFYPVGLTDILEIVPDFGKPHGHIHFRITGIKIEGNEEDNLCVKAYRLLAADYDIPAVAVHLHKIIPVGSGLGGGSSDAAFMLKGLNNLFKLEISDDKLEGYASRLGSDCAFFIRNHPVSAHGKGNLFKTTDIRLNDYHIIIVCPPVHIKTSEAYSFVTPANPEFPPEKIVHLPINEWKKKLKNDFEKSIFHLYPQIRYIKDKLYNQGALYASMSGSGSSVYGIYKETPVIPEEFLEYFTWCGPLKIPIGV